MDEFKILEVEWIVSLGDTNYVRSRCDFKHEANFQWHCLGDYGEYTVCTEKKAEDLEEALRENIKSLKVLI